MPSHVSTVDQALGHPFCTKQHILSTTPTYTPHIVQPPFLQPPTLRLSTYKKPCLYNLNIYNTRFKQPKSLQLPKYTTPPPVWMVGLMVALMVGPYADSCELFFTSNGVGQWCRSPHRCLWCRTTKRCQHMAYKQGAGRTKYKKIPHTGDTNSLGRCR